MSGLVDFKGKAIEIVKEAVSEDNAGNYENALRLYKAALEYFSTHLKYDKNPASKKAITAKVRQRGAARGVALRRRGALTRAERPAGCRLAPPQFTEYLARAEELQRCVARLASSSCRGGRR
jgi:hypothetical protein